MFLVVGHRHQHAALRGVMKLGERISAMGRKTGVGVVGLNLEAAHHPVFEP
jgi:hypothetical protein